MAAPARPNAPGLHLQSNLRNAHVTRSTRCSRLHMAFYWPAGLDLCTARVARLYSRNLTTQLRAITPLQDVSVPRDHCTPLAFRRNACHTPLPVAPSLLAKVGFLLDTRIVVKRAVTTELATVLRTSWNCVNHAGFRNCGQSVTSDFRAIICALESMGSSSQIVKKLWKKHRT
jgi:CRISPR/Cas system endoribonuclease Cas6 (RAMP superfamily)